MFVQWRNMALCSLILLMLQACSTSTPPVPMTEVAATEVEASEVADCGWDGIAVAWIDRNQNGQYEPDEQPLPDVVFHNSEGDTATSDWKGDAQFNLFMAGCGEWDISISPVVPDGYVLTTPATLTGSTSEYGKVFAFGFMTQPGVPTVTERAPRPSCTMHHLGKANFYDLTDLAITPNGTIWAASFNAGVFMLAPNTSDWVHYTASQGLVNDQVRSITVESDTSIWFATAGGASHFDGQAWKSYTSADGLLPQEVTSIAVDNGLIWFATYAGTSMLDMNTGTWRSFTSADGLSDDFLHSVAVAEDGSIWFAGMDLVSRMDWPDRPAGTPTWSHYEYQVDNIEHGPDNTLWFVGFSGIQYFDSQTNSLQDYAEELSNAGFNFSVHSLAFAPDGSMWTGSETSNEIFHMLRDARSQTITVRSYDSRAGLPKRLSQDDKVEAIAFAPDGSLWMVTQEDATQCIFTG